MLDIDILQEELKVPTGGWKCGGAMRKKGWKP